MKHTECKDCELNNSDCGYHFKMDGVTNYDIVSLSACDKYGNCMFFKPKVNPKDYLISREALKEHKFLTPQVKVVGGRHNGKMQEQIIRAYQKGWNDCIDAIIENAPTVEPKKGKWISNNTDINSFMNRGRHCSLCNYTVEFSVNYCPNCGADMRGEEE